MKTIFAILLFPSLVSAAVLDAAELDRYGDPLEYQGSSMVAWRATIDNTGNVEDITGVRFKMNFTGTVNAMPNVWWTEPINPWFGASNARWEFTVGPITWQAGRVYYPPTMEWGPAFLNMSTSEVVHDTVPAGCSWDAVMAFAGPDVKLFQSPASGDLTVDGVTTTLYDDDPLPQSIPEPFSLVILLSVLLLKRHRMS